MVVILLVTLFFVNKVEASVANDTVYKGGALVADEVWTNNKVYIVYLDLLITDGVSLTILPGVEVRIKYGKKINVDKGVLRVQGDENQKVKFVPDYSHPSHDWKWKGITLREANFEDQSYFNNVIIENAQVALTIEDSYSVNIIDSKIIGCQNQGIVMRNSSSCNIINSEITDNYSGIEIQVSFLNGSSNNSIYNCVIQNQDQNIYVFRESGGVFKDNQISRNFISGGNSGIWIGNIGNAINSHNVIEKNVFFENGGEVGYALFLAYDSTIVRNNIFYNNNNAVYFENNGQHSTFEYNSFYKNTKAVSISSGAVGNVFKNNTFSNNITEVIGIKEAMSFRFYNNNILNFFKEDNIVVNNTVFDISVDSNYWNTVDTATISNLLYDFFDNPNLGKLNFIPFLTGHDTTNPISPPGFIKKQLIGDNVRIVWDKNEEADFVGYRLYFGDYSNYSFSNHIDMSQDTVYFFDNSVSIYDEIAITAYDSGAIYSNGIFDGHESPYGFATTYPYAGGDTLICINQEELQITRSNAPMDYQSVLWITNGDGVFDNPNLLMPAYSPGNSDIETGFVTLTMNIVTQDTILSDSFVLSIVDDPAVETVKDTLIIRGSSIDLTSTKASNYNEVFWESSGDGYFNNNCIIDPVYVPGYNDFVRGEVSLVVHVYSVCGYDSDTVKVGIMPHYSLEGNVWLGDLRSEGAAVVAFRKEESTTRATNVVNTSADGYFIFEELMIGQYYIYCVPDTNLLQSFIPCYYPNKTQWDESHIIDVVANVYDIDIFNRSGYTLPLGKGGFKWNCQYDK